ncbi:PDDEXK nuclease domain-containing protein [Paenarthrobacter sp. AR 02]|uniref:PDDEXK nuclease domain-containing protein n=1 Tax=Paenarthrobacter sp. AR 02 TaxID=2899821 RepID=UPI001F42D57E|nr:PDDEXK nuclease domain-containing protein [Paenarthrobacter sp. AR 02]MCF3140933.1 PDDEXK nuclease domain-containing protein [Paenarthrobacter sp. AR 02]
MTDSRALSLPESYTDLLATLKDRVRAARITALRTVNTQLIELYWSIGKTVLERQQIEQWGSGVMGRLADDLRAEFPEMKGLSRSNLFYMRGFATAWPDPIVQQPVGQLPWGHITVLLDKLETRRDRDWYAGAAVEYGWSRNVLLNMIMNRTLERTGAAPSNFVQRLVGPDSELAQQVAKDPYNFEFLGLSGEVAERDLELALTSRITETLRELGPGFSFVGRQVHFDVDGDDYYVDMLFFHMDQNRYVVIELKTGKFQPEYAGKLNFYVALVDDMLRREHHNETIGILICGTKNDRSVRYSLGRSTSPMAVAAYTYDKLPPAEQQALPTEGHLVAALEWAEPEDQPNAE